MNQNPTLDATTSDRRETAAVPQVDLRGLSLLNSIDLAFHALRWQWKGLLLTYLAIALPTACAIAGFSMIDYRLAWCAPVLWVLVSGPLGVVIATTMTALLMGNATTYREALGQVRFKVIVMSILRRMVALAGLLMCGIGSLVAAVHFTFQPENHALRSRRKSGHEHHLKKLISSHHSDLVVNAFGLGIWIFCLSIVLLISADVLAEVWFGASFCLGPLLKMNQGLAAVDAVPEEYWEISTLFLTTDPRLLFAATLCVLAAFSLGRLAWVGEYINLRVREDCWDLELAMNQAAHDIRRKSTPRPLRVGLLALATLGLLSLILGNAPLSARAADTAQVPSHPVVPQARKTLEQPEYRYFEHFNADDVEGVEQARESLLPPRSRSSSSDASSSRTLPGSMRSSKKGSGDGTEKKVQRSKSRSSSKGSGPSSSQSQPSSSQGSAPAEPATPSSGMNAPSLDLSSLLGLGAVGTFLAYLIVAVVIVAIIVAIVMSIMASLRSRELEFTDANTTALEEGEILSEPGLIPADIYLARADELAGLGRYRDAIAQLLLSGMSFAERSGLVRYRRGLTLRDYQRAMGFETDLSHGFSAIVRVFEPLEFGRQPHTAEAWLAARTAYASTFEPLIRNESLPAALRTGDLS
ncbi:hypothetical protein Spb1_02440 [Planctopirus ephydatiae]|uniref:DUF4129 domain-containing protein n=1 Tax=Planctopirus ephydatiae TaxID=2528019 RepID=A0A518GIF3_9PLAN|nr:DUF4129 domain-containing protein [Planctopirus ephydatiae]QDV28381.1 hypothetical protein Spb1_02440 [Planctopirus ephydatiae]